MIANYSNGSLKIRTYFHNVQGGGFIKDILKKSTPNLLEFEYNEVLDKYFAIDIPIEYLIYKPDW